MRRGHIAASPGRLTGAKDFDDQQNRRPPHAKLQEFGDGCFAPDLPGDGGCPPGGFAVRSLTGGC